VTANPNITISRAHVPWRCRWARVVLLGPLTLHDVDAGSFARHEGEQYSTVQLDRACAFAIVGHVQLMA
jgi:hypothetical protein